MNAARAAPTPADGAHPAFVQSLDAARARAKAAQDQADAKNRPPTDRIEQLVREGKLPPRGSDLGVGYEPTPEEVLGDYAEASAPDGTEDLPDADSVLAGDAPEAPPGWGAPPAPAAAAASHAAPSAAPSAAPLASGPSGVQSKRKRGR